jgi:hypothetical protein
VADMFCNAACSIPTPPPPQNKKQRTCYHRPPPCLMHSPAEVTHGPNLIRTSLLLDPATMFITDILWCPCSTPTPAMYATLAAAAAAPPPPGCCPDLISMLVLFDSGIMRVKMTGRPASSRRTTGRVTAAPQAVVLHSHLRRTQRDHAGQQQTSRQTDSSGRKTAPPPRGGGAARPPLHRGWGGGDAGGQVQPQTRVA